jgi:hypothetical protein
MGQGTRPSSHVHGEGCATSIATLCALSLDQCRIAEIRNSAAADIALYWAVRGRFA